MTKIDAIVYRTPACDDHLGRNETDDCPFCKIDEVWRTVGERNAEIRSLSATLNSVTERADDLSDKNARLEDELELLRNVVREFPLLRTSSDHTLDDVLIWLEKINDWKLRIRDLVPDMNERAF